METRVKIGMKIGIFDSGLGGLIIARAIRKEMPKYDYVYYGDTKNMPYGNKSHQEVLKYTKKAVDYLFREENCNLIIIACNTASARALRKIQQEYLPQNFPDRRILGVLIPGAEEASKYERIGIIATKGTVASKTFPIEIRKLNKKVKVFQCSAPTLVPLIEMRDMKKAEKELRKYLKPLIAKKLDALVLGCTHYPILKKEIKKILPQRTKIIAQDEIVPKKVKNYLKRHPEIEKKLSKNKKIKAVFTGKVNYSNSFTNFIN